MTNIEHNLGVKRRSEAAQWAGGALRSLATIAMSALVVWIAVSAINESGLLPRPAPAEPRTPAGDNPFPLIAYG